MTPTENQTEKTPLQCKVETLRAAAEAAMGSIFMPAAAKEQLSAIVDFAAGVADELKAVREEMGGMQENLRAELLNAKRDAVLSGLPTLPNA
jgi:hypothetical protein